MRLDSLTPGISEFDLDGEHYYVEREANGKVWCRREGDDKPLIFHGHLDISQSERRKWNWKGLLP